MHTLNLREMIMNTTQANYPFHTVEDLRQFFLFKLLTEAQQQEILSLQDRAARHTKFAQILHANGFLQEETSAS